LIFHETQESSNETTSANNPWLKGAVRLSKDFAQAILNPPSK
jgi:hypothetical protein